MATSPSRYPTLPDPTAARAVLLDLEGTLYAAGRPIEGAAEAVAWLRGRGLAVRFLTNIDSRMPEEISRELAGLGLDIDDRDLFTPLSAASAMILASAGARVHALLGTELLPAIPRLAAQPPYTHVLVGDCRDVLDYSRLDAAFRAMRDGAQLLALQRGRYFKRADGDHIDTGAVVAGLEYATGVEAHVLGKPAPSFFVLAAADAEVDPALCVVVGDDATTDIRGGAAAGAVTVQVRTGKFADQEAEGLTGAARFTIDSIDDLPALLTGERR